MFKAKFIISAIAAAVLTAGTGTAVYAYYNNSSTSGIAVPDFVGSDKATVENWIEKYDNEDQVQLVYDYSEDVEVDIVMEQSLEEGTVLEADDTLQLTLSLGPDEKALFELPDFTGKKRAEIEEWFNKYHFTAVTYTYEAVEDASIEKDTFISMTPEAGKEVLRTDAVEVKLVTDEITVPDLATMSRDDIQAWGDKWGVTISFEEEESEMLQDGAIASVSAANGAIVKRGDTIVVKIAKHVDRPQSEEAIQQTTTQQQTDANAGADAGSGSGATSNNGGTNDDSSGGGSQTTVTNACPILQEYLMRAYGDSENEIKTNFQVFIDRGCKITFDKVQTDERPGLIQYSITSEDGNSAYAVINIPQ